MHIPLLFFFFLSCYFVFNTELKSVPPFLSPKLVRFLNIMCILIIIQPIPFKIMPL